VQRTFARWRQEAIIRIESPLDRDKKEAALVSLISGQPVVVDGTVLKVEKCEWEGDSSGFQIFGKNQLGVELGDFFPQLDHAAPLQVGQVKKAIEWAEQQLSAPDSFGDDPDCFE
jgi:hypothetical protein